MVQDNTGLSAAGVVALNLAPEIGRWLFGPDAAQVAAAVQSALVATTGTADPAAQVAALENSDTAAALRVALAAIADAHAAAADTAGAQAASALSQDRSPMAWGAPIVSVVVLVTFGAVVSIALFRPVPPASEAMLNVLLGTLGAMATSVVAYWVGSSVGSARKDERLARLVERER